MAAYLNGGEEGEKEKSRINEKPWLVAGQGDRGDQSHLAI